LESRISLEILEQCSSNLAPESINITKETEQRDTFCVVAKATLLVHVFSLKKGQWVLLGAHMVQYIFLGVDDPSLKHLGILVSIKTGPVV